MTDHILNDPNVLDHICGELNDDATNAHGETASQYKRLVDLLSTAAVENVSATFDENLQQKLNHESRPPSTATRRWPVLSAAAALVAVILLLFSSSPDGGTTSIAWADVVQAMDQSPHFHLTALIDNPRRADEARRLFTLEIYYRSPDQWRAQGLGHVQFLNGKKTRMYDAAQRKFVEQASTHLRLIPDDFVKQFEQGDLLNAVLYMLFRGKPPQGQPVKSDLAASAQGIEIFDYAHDATKQWARIWVLKQSRLPLKIKVFEPRGNDFTLVTFDYSDPQPASYFNPDQFEKVIKDNRLQQPYQILRAGMSLIDGKPTNRSHVHQLQGDYKPAKILDTVGNDQGAFAVTHSDPGNMRPEGGNLEEKVYDMPTDNWGNIYFSSGAFKPIKGNWQRFYVPVAPFKRGQGQRIVTLTYAIEFHQSVKGIYEHKHHVLSEDHVPIDLNTAEKVSAKYQKNYWSKAAFDRVYVKHMRITAPATVQWQYVQTQLKDRPDDPALLLWAYKLQKDHDRKDQARQLMADRLVPMFMAAPTKHRQMEWEIGRYFKWLYQQQGIEAVTPIITRLKEAREQVRNTKDRSLRQHPEWLLEDSPYGVSWITDLPEKLAAFKVAPKPKLVDVVHGSDKLFAVRVQLPKDPMKVEARSGSESWRPQWLTSDQWKTLTSDYNQDTEIYSWLLEPLDTAATKVALQFKPFVAGRPSTGGKTIQTDWAMTIDLPTIPTAESAQQWWSKHITDRPWRTNAFSKYQQLNKLAHEALNAKDYKRVIDINLQRLTLPKDQWPEYYFHPANAHLNQYETARQECQNRIMSAKLHLGRLAEVLPKLDAMDAQFPLLNPDDQDSGRAFNDLIWQRAQLRGIRLAAVEYLIDQNRLDEAQTLLDNIAKDRPNPLDYHNRMVQVRYQYWSSDYHPRSKIQSLWRKFDIVQWNLISQR